jgi:N-acetyl-anhydromuramyl-L-alanine amidase AmpD
MDSQNPSAEAPRMITITFLNNDGGGFADRLQVVHGTTIGTFFQEKFDGHSSRYQIRVNNDRVASHYVLQDEDKVAVTPTKQQGGDQPGFTDC